MLTPDAEMEEPCGSQAVRRDPDVPDDLSDEQIEYQVRDRMSFTRFLGLEFEDDIPDDTTLWLFREKLAQAGFAREAVRAVQPGISNAKGYIARGVQLVDATIVPVPKQRNSREENETVKRGEAHKREPETTGRGLLKRRKGSGALTGDITKCATSMLKL